MYERISLATDPSSLKYIQIESVIFLACNYFHIIYRFSRAQKQKLKNIVKFMPYIRRVRKTFTWDPMNKFRVLKRQKLSTHNKWCHPFLLVAFFLRALMRHIKKLVFFRFGTYSQNSSWVRAAGKCMNNETMGHYTLIAIKKSLGSKEGDGEIVFLYLHMTWPDFWNVSFRLK